VDAASADGVVLGYGHRQDDLPCRYTTVSDGSGESFYNDTHILRYGLTNISPSSTAETTHFAKTMLILASYNWSFWEISEF